MNILLTNDGIDDQNRVDKKKTKTKKDVAKNK